MKLRSIRPPDPGDITPNPNDPASVPPATVGPNVAVPGDPDGVEIGAGPPWQPLPRIMPSAWSGWPEEWWPPAWGGGTGWTALDDTAWMCVDLNASVLSTMPPYLVGAAVSLDTSWMTNPDPDLYTSWEEFCKQLFWDFQLGESFVLCTARYATGWPARFHAVAPWFVTVEMVNGLRRYTIGSSDVTGDMLHVRYKSNVAWPRGVGPLEGGWTRVVADRMLSRYATGFAAAGGVPASVLISEEELTPEQAAELKSEWVAARQQTPGAPAVLSGGVSWQPTQANPADMALVDLSDRARAGIAQLLGVPAPLIGIPVGDPQTYRNVKNFFDFHWRAGLRPKAQTVMAALSAWLLPRGTTIELNRDAYIEPEPLERAQVAQIYNTIRDPQGNPVLTVQDIQQIERMQLAGHAGTPPPTSTETAGA